MKITEKDTKKHAHSKSCKVYEYEFPSKLFNCATAKITGRYPDKGRVVNKECEEIYYVLSGSGVLHSDRGEFKLKKGDLYHFKKGEKYWVEGKDMHIFMSNAPPWTPEQHINLE